MSAKGVKSFPVPTFLPAWSEEPTWRTRMLPARTGVPAYTFTPRRCAFDPRPLRVEPAPFLSRDPRTPHPTNGPKTLPEDRQGRQGLGVQAFSSGRSRQPPNEWAPYGSRAWRSLRKVHTGAASG